MEIYVNNKRVNFFSDIQITLDFDTIADTFGFKLYFNPENDLHRELTEIGSFYDVRLLSDDGELLLTGYIIGQSFSSSSAPELVIIQGYSKTGVLMDSNIPPSLYPLQTDGLSLLDISRKLTEPFGIKVINKTTGSAITQSIPETNASETQSISGYLSELASQRDIVMSCDIEGNLVFKSSQADSLPVASYTQKTIGVESMQLTFNGQNSNSEVTVMKEASDIPQDDSGQDTISNPLVKRTFRPSVKIQTTGDEIDTSKAARIALATQLKNLTLLIELSQWQQIRPNQVIEVENPEIHIYKKTKFFVESVTMTRNPERQNMSLKCVLPEVYGGKRQIV